MSSPESGAKMTNEQAASAAKEKLDIPTQFHTTALALITSLCKKFPNCDQLPGKKAMLEGIAGKEGGMLRTMMVQEWYKHTRDHAKGIEKKEHGIFKKLRDAPFVGDIRLDKKWKDPSLSMQSRDTIWSYIQNLTAMSEIVCGEKSVPPELEAIERLRKNVGIEIDEDTRKGNFDLDQITQFLQNAVANPTGENARDLLTVGKTYGAAAGGMGDLQKMMASQMMQHIGNPSSSDASAEGPKKAHAAGKKKRSSK
jgi:hypothetical protein